MSENFLNIYNTILRNKIYQRRRTLFHVFYFMITANNLMIKTVLDFLNEISLPKPDKNSYAANFLKLYENGSEATYVHITKENAYGKEYLQISNDTGACMSDRVQPSEPVSYIDLIQLSDNICTVAEHAKESIPFQLTADEFCLVTGVDIYKSNLQEDKK